MNQRIKAIIIDDEERARRVLSSMLEEYCADKIEVIGQCANVPQGVLEINRKNPDVVFLDIEMPDYSGFELLDFFKEVDFEIIFVTAYNQYALQAFEVSAVDYILKPVRIDQLEKAVDKLFSKQSIQMKERLDLLKTNLQSENSKIAVPVSDGLILLKVCEISHLIADGSYSKIFLKGGEEMLVSKKLKYFEELLANQHNFYRIHRSSIINMEFVVKYNRHESEVTLENGIGVKVSRDQKSKFEERIKRFTNG
ncbi:MAG: LytTR family DNA-binding domain-containing protein [Flavobacteriales bacterium]|jgi:two-component system LytT family response regulator|nr:LytTR family DNA-binding domain-containing protein [Flavobacteriales bacterium]